MQAFQQDGKTAMARRAVGSNNADTDSGHVFGYPAFERRRMCSDFD
jgi:peptide methionine sulfoxide reductase MsrB